MCFARPGVTRGFVHVVIIEPVTNFTCYKQLYLVGSDD
jgi:hypothetical protein